ncbi:MAG: aconitate hydratase [Bacillales bacterium]|nr:aconitate hydratase [Bacillales bacterium]
MGYTLTEKVLKEHLISGQLTAGEEICIKVDQTLTQDTTGTMAYLELEAMNIGKVKTEVSVAYIDHNMLQTGFENADDHAFIKSMAINHGIIFSKPGNGICHQLHLERFGKPGKTLIGSDSHTPTCGALGMLAIGAGGLDVSIGMATGTYCLKMPKIIKVELRGKLQKNVSSKDVILELLRQLSVKGGVNSIIEYSGDGVKTLSLTQRATITNMGAELGATTSIFPADERTLDFLTRQGRSEDYHPLSADTDAVYDSEIIIELDQLVPMIARPHSPDAVTPIPSEKIVLNQVAIGSCTNSSYEDLMQVAKILEGERVHPTIDLVISPGSSNIITMLADNGALSTFIKAGARILEAGCGPCIGMGQAPKSAGVSLRTFNRNFKGRSGTFDAQVYLTSPIVAAYSAIKGYIADPRELTKDLTVELPEKFTVSNNYFIFPNDEKVQVEKGPNIGEFPNKQELESQINGIVILKTGDNITTDDIAPSSADLLKLRSNIPKLSEYCFKTIIPDFKARCQANGGGIIIGGDNYGQGSSREHAALLPLYLGIQAVIAKSFARIHKSNLVNAGIIPLEFADTTDYELFTELETHVQILNLADQLQSDQVEVLVNEKPILCKIVLSQRDKDILACGGMLNYSLAKFGGNS